VKHSIKKYTGKYINKKSGWLPQCVGNCPAMCSLNKNIKTLTISQGCMLNSKKKIKNHPGLLTQVMAK